MGYGRGEIWEVLERSEVWEAADGPKAGSECRLQERLTGVQNLASQQKAAPAGDHG